MPPASSASASLPAASSAASAASRASAGAASAKRAAPGDVRAEVRRGRGVFRRYARVPDETAKRLDARGAVAAEPAERRERPRVLDAFPVRLCEACLEIGNHARLHERLRGGGQGRGKRRLFFRFRAGKNFRRVRKTRRLRAPGARRRRRREVAKHGERGRGERAVVGRLAPESRFVAKRATVAVSARRYVVARVFENVVAVFRVFREPGHRHRQRQVPGVFPHQARRVLRLTGEHEERRGEQVPVLGQKRVRVFQRRLFVFPLGKVAREEIRQPRVARRAEQTGERGGASERGEEERARVLSSRVPGGGERATRGGVHQFPERLVVAHPQRRARQPKRAPRSVSGRRRLESQGLQTLRRFERSRRTSGARLARRCATPTPALPPAGHTCPAVPQTARVYMATRASRSARARRSARNRRPASSSPASARRPVGVAQRAERRQHSDPVGAGEARQSRLRAAPRDERRRLLRLRRGEPGGRVAVARGVFEFVRSMRIHAERETRRRARSRGSRRRTPRTRRTRPRRTRAGRDRRAPPRR